MATKSVATPQISIGAQEFLDRFDALHDLMDRIIGADGMLAILDETFETDTPANRALGGVWRLIHDCREKACALDWPPCYRSQAEEALGITEDAA